VNNHAHVLTGTRLSTELLYTAIRRSDVRTLVTGAVQLKISMGNLKSLILDVPSESGLRRLEALCASEMALIRTLTEGSVSLVKTRDTLLPLLMSGQLSVNNAENQVEALV